MTDAESIEMDQDLAKRLLVEGATFIFLGVPVGTQFGIDMKSWRTGEKFEGVKMIPPGIHFVHYRAAQGRYVRLRITVSSQKNKRQPHTREVRITSATNKHGDVTPRVGFMHDFKRSEFVVKKWDSENEGMSPVEVSEIEVARLKADLLNLDRHLGPYPFDTYKKWKSLTDRVTVKHLSRLLPISGLIRSALDLIAGEKNASPKIKKRRSRPSTAEEKEDDLLPDLKPLPGTELRLTPLPSESYPKGSTAAEITKHSIDQSYTLESMLSTYENLCDLIGELQFTFVCFLVGYSLEALDHWKMLVKLLCSCETAVTRRTQLYSQFIEALEAQLAEVPEDFLVDIVASNNVIYRSLRDLFRTMQTCEGVEGRLRSRAERFRNRLTEKFMWDFSHLNEDEDDEAPVVVVV